MLNRPSLLVKMEGNSNGFVVYDEEQGVIHYRDDYDDDDDDVVGRNEKNPHRHCRAVTIITPPGAENNNRTKN